MNPEFNAHYYLNEYRPGLGDYSKAGISLADRIKIDEWSLGILLSYKV